MKFLLTTFFWLCCRVSMRLIPSTLVKVDMKVKTLEATNN